MLLRCRKLQRQATNRALKLPGTPGGGPIALAEPEGAQAAQIAQETALMAQASAPWPPPPWGLLASKGSRGSIGSSAAALLAEIILAKLLRLPLGPGLPTFLGHCCTGLRPLGI